MIKEKKEEDNMGFFLVGFILWSLIVVSLVLLIGGFWKKSWKAFLVSGLAMLVPSIMLTTQQGWFSLFVLLPLMVLGLSFYTKKKVRISE